MLARRLLLECSEAPLKGYSDSVLPIQFKLLTVLSTYVQKELFRPGIRLGLGMAP
jgi:hypothetical protein